MRKLGQPVLDDGPGHRRWKYSSALTILVGILLSPLAYESGLLCYARWRGMTGPIPEVKTPVFDGIVSAAQWVKSDFQDFARPVTRHATWNSTYMIPFIMVCTVIAVVMLRK